MILNTYATWLQEQYNIEPIATTVDFPNGILTLNEFHDYVSDLYRSDRGFKS